MRPYPHHLSQLAPKGPNSKYRSYGGQGFNICICGGTQTLRAQQSVFRVHTLNNCAHSLKIHHSTHGKCFLKKWKKSQNYISSLIKELVKNMHRKKQKEYIKKKQEWEQQCIHAFFFGLHSRFSVILYYIHNIKIKFSIIILQAPAEKCPCRRRTFINEQISGEHVIFQWKLLCFDLML